MSSADKRAEDAIIQQAIIEANKQIFLPKGVQVKLLRECPFAMPALIDWLYEDWHTYDTTLTKERLAKGLEAQAQAVGVPFTLIALRDQTPIGAISLKSEGPAELADFKGPWPGSFHVIPEERIRRIGWHLGKLLLETAKRLGYTEVNFYTSNPRNVERYKKVFGAQVIDMRPFRGHSVSILKLDL